jgi:glycosyltransferase involved in cell wall biosynthesis
MKSLCFVIAAKDRPDDLRRMLASLAAQSHTPDLVIIVDSSAAPARWIVDEFGQCLRLKCLRRQPPSASAQRNAGIEIVPEDIELIGFLDDDAILEPDALEKMLDFWVNAPSDLGGAAFNMVNHPAQTFSGLKRWRLVKALGLYSGEPGRVTLSGWQTLAGLVAKDTWMDWLPSGAAVWRRAILRTCRFDEFFNGYSYLEDVDFSYTVRRHWRLAIVADAYYYHHPSPIRHASQFAFGRTEVRNRLYFVTKHRLSSARCWLGLIVRMAMSLGQALTETSLGPLFRAFGNLTGMVDQIRYGRRRLV